MKKVLIVPGLKPFIEQEKNILTRADYRIFTATSGEEALRIHRVQQTDLIIVDLQMPGMDGDKLCSCIKKDRELKQAVVILICRDTKADIQRCVKSGADSYLTIPVNADVLLAQVRRVLDIRDRESTRIPLEIKVVGSYGYRTFFCHAHNLSKSGMLIETDRVLRKGDPVACLFRPSGSREIIVNGHVMRVKVKEKDIYQYGIKFSALPADSRSAIEAFMTHGMEGAEKKKTS